ncbi:phage minor head protein [Streptomyces sp. NRRL S-350]|uniref:phage minor head protein n=1 Tax=Streptomyces sp. NRRL S-350 TaxID=1463902 RepID=UPI0004C026E6|nr:phage minor head protein [Streptomyces sp. NRRL S-350]
MASDRELDQAEQQIADAVAQALAEVADEFAAELRNATEIVAARFSVSRIARMWRSRVGGIMRRLLGTAETAANDAADSVDAELPAGWDDLPGRYDDGRALPRSLGDYVTVTERLLNSVGDRLAAAAARDLAEGVAAGEDVDQLRARLRETFAREGAQLGDAREERIARTEATRAWNTATEAAGRDLTGPDRPLVKQWITRHDERVRDAHQETDGQIQLLGEPFTVGGVSMAVPGDPTAPPDLTINCRCRIALAPQPRTAAFEVQEPPRAAFSDRRETDVDPDVTAAADGSHLSGAMIALMPTAADAERLAFPGGEDVGELHLTLAFLGEGADWTPEQRNELIAEVRAFAKTVGGTIAGRAFGVNHWNPGSASPSWVWAVGDDRDRPAGAPVLEDAHDAALMALEGTHDHPELPVQHSPWAPHVCGIYSPEGWPLQEMTDRLGPVTFDRLRVAFAGEYADIPLGTTEEETPMEPADATAAGIETRGWSTPDDTALAFENEQTGDGRVFAKGSLYWSDGPWPLQYAEQMLGGHEGAELIGSIQELNRTGDRIGGSGVLYPARPAAADAVLLLDEGAPLGVSVDLDDAEVEFVDRTYNPADQVAEEDDGWYGLAASARLAHASFLRLDDGSWAITATAAGDWTASGVTMSRTQHQVQLITGPDGRISGDALRAAFGGTGVLTRPTGEPITASDVELMQIPLQEERARTAAAGDPDTDEGLVIHSEKSGDFLIRVTRARLRGATLVAMPAYNRARIVLDPVGELAASAVGDLALPVHDDPEARWDGPGAQKRILAYATGDDGAVDPKKLAAGFLWRDDEADPATASAYKLPFADVFDGELHIVPAGVYAVASVLQGGMGGVDLPEKDSDAVKANVEKLYARIAEEVDGAPDAPPWVEEETASATAAADDSGVHDQVVVFVCSSPVPVGASDVAKALGLLVSTVRNHLAQAVESGRLVRLARGVYVGPSSHPEGPVTASADISDEDLVASAWTALQGLPPMPAAWFVEPTVEELPPGSGGVHYANGRIYGWVAQAGEPHAGIPGKKVTIESLGEIDLSHFLRKKFPLDDGGSVKAGALTMNVGHHRDGAECETASCQFDDTRTVAGIVTVGMNERGMWFSGAAGPWLSDWDRLVFAACQPSYHLRQKRRGGQWELRAVLSVPVPGHSSPLLASAVAERSNLALAASAVLADTADTVSGHVPDIPADVSAIAEDIHPDLGGHRPDTVSGHGADTYVSVSVEDVAEVVAAAMSDPGFVDRLAEAMEQRQAARAEVAELAAALAPIRQKTTAGMSGTTENGV